MTELMAVGSWAAADFPAPPNRAPAMEVQDLVEAELDSQASTVNLTAAANYLTPGVAQAMHPALNNIHCEGYPGRRYHQGQQRADAIEELALARAKRLFGAEHANVQPYRGTTALMAALLAVLEPGDRILGMDTRAGGHYSSGGSVHLLGSLFDITTYEVSPRTYRLDYDDIERRAVAGGAKVIVCGDTSYPRRWDFERMAEIAGKVDAVLVADLSQTLGLVAAGALPSPVPHAGIVVGAAYKTLRGPRAGVILCRRQYAAQVDRAVYPALQGGPNVSVLAGLAVALAEAAQPDFARYGAQVVRNARALAAGLARHGLTVVTSGTDNHACLLDLRDVGLAGRQAAARLEDAGILSNANQVPFDPAPPARPSGLRVGTPAVTSLGMGQLEMGVLADLIGALLSPQASTETVLSARARVTALRRRFPGTDPSGRRPLEDAR